MSSNITHAALAPQLTDGQHYVLSAVRTHSNEQARLLLAERYRLIPQIPAEVDDDGASLPPILLGKATPSVQAEVRSFYLWVKPNKGTKSVKAIGAKLYSCIAFRRKLTSQFPDRFCSQFLGT